MLPTPSSVLGAAERRNPAKVGRRSLAKAIPWLSDNASRLP